MRRGLRAAGLTLLALSALPGPTHAETPPSPPASAPASRPASPVDPFLKLRVVQPRAKLPPLRSARVRDKREAQDRSREGDVIVTISSTPKGVAVLYGGKVLGTTPLSLKAQRGSTPFDVVLSARGYMTLRTRIQRKTSRTYFFKLNPAKIR